VEKKDGKDHRKWAKATGGRAEESGGPKSSHQMDNGLD
jgi:hypothetical protein